MKMIGNTTCGRKTFVNGNKTGPVNFALSPILEGKARRLCNWMQSGVLIKLVMLLVKKERALVRRGSQSRTQSLQAFLSGHQPLTKSRRNSGLEIEGEQGWLIGESVRRLPPMWRWFESRI